VVNHKIPNYFLSLLDLMPLTSFEGKPIGTGKPGQLTKELLTAYRKLINEAMVSRTITYGGID